jgi:hypothetical protein
MGHITSNQAQDIWNEARNHPVVAMSRLDKYDPEGNLGFCFGRAAFVHLELLRRGVQKEAIQKAFAVGEMKTEKTTWQFHVTTVVRGENGTWLAIDPSFTAPLSLEAWYARLEEVGKGKVRLYITHPSKIGPSGWEYNTQAAGLKDPIYNKYFEEMFSGFKAEPAKVSYKKVSCSKAYTTPKGGYPPSQATWYRQISDFFSL